MPKKRLKSKTYENGDPCVPSSVALPCAELSPKSTLICDKQHPVSDACPHTLICEKRYPVSGARPHPLIAQLAELVVAAVAARARAAAMPRARWPRAHVLALLLAHLVVRVVVLHALPRAPARTRGRQACWHWRPVHI